MNYNLKELGQIYASSGTENPNLFYSPEILKGEPFTVITAHNSTTGRHGSGKTKILYQVLLTGSRSEKSFDSSIKVFPWKESPHYSEFSAIVVTEKPFLVKTFQGDEISPKILKNSPVPGEASDVLIRGWQGPKGIVYLYFK